MIELSAAEELELLDAELTNAELANAELTEAELAELDTPDGGSPAGAPAEPAEPAEPARLSARELTEQGIGVVQTAHTDLAAYHRTQWEQTVEVFGERLAQLAWNRRLSTYYFFDGACLEDADPTPVVTVFRSPPVSSASLNPPSRRCPPSTPSSYRSTVGGAQCRYMHCGTCTRSTRWRLLPPSSRRCVPVAVVNAGISTAPMMTTTRW